jgi:hypothetical protein
MYSVEVRPKEGSKMKVQLQAENQKKAFRYAQNRWPNATVSKPELVK